MSGIWSFLELVGGQGAIARTWRRWLDGEEFEPFRQALLRRLSNPAASYPCPRGCGCTHRVVRYPDNGGIAAVCQCEPWCCDTIPVTEKELVLYSPDPHAIGRAVARAFGFQPREREMGIPGVLQIGAFTDTAIPAMLVVQPDRRMFHARICEVAAVLRQKFILIAPTATFMDGAAHGLLAGLGGMFIPLSATIRVTPAGQLQTIRPPLEILEPVTPKTEPADESVVASALGLIQILDKDPVKKRPTHAEFFRLYCLDELSLSQIMRKTGCSRGTASYRKKRCETVLKAPLDTFIRYGAVVDTLERQRREANARYIHKRGAIYGDAGFDESG